MEKEVIAFIVVMFLLIKWDNDRFKTNERSERRLQGKIRSMKRKGYGYYEDSEKDQIVFYKPRRRKKRK